MVKWIIIAILILILLFCLIMVIDCNRFVVRNYTYSSDKVKKTTRFVMLSDLHSTKFGKDNIKLINKIKELNPDGILIAGDMYTAERGTSTYIAEQLVTTLAKDYRIYYANGNHELKTRERKDEFGNIYEEYQTRLINNGVNILNNINIYLQDCNIKIYGLDLPFDYYKKFIKLRADKDFLNGLLSSPEDNELNLLIAHNPEYFEDYAEWGADLIVSGHYHGGLMRLPIIGGVISPRYKLFPKYDYGVYEKDGSKMILSCGLGTHTLPIRIFNPGEIALITIQKC